MKTPSKIASSRRRSSKTMAFLAGGAFAVLAFVSGGQEALAAACPSGQSWCSEHNQCEAPLTDEEAKAKIKAMVTIFGRPTPVELDFLQVEKI
jgi:hypothetical protein